MFIQSVTHMPVSTSLFSGDANGVQSMPGQQNLPASDAATATVATPATAAAPAAAASAASQFSSSNLATLISAQSGRSGLRTPVHDEHRSAGGYQPAAQGGVNLLKQPLAGATASALAITT